MTQEQSQNQNVNIILQGLTVPPNKALPDGNKDDAIRHEDWIASLEGRVMGLGILLSHTLHDIDRKRINEYLEDYPPKHFSPPWLDGTPRWHF